MTRSLDLTQAADYLATATSNPCNYCGVGQGYTCRPLFVHMMDGILIHAGRGAE